MTTSRRPRRWSSIPAMLLALVAMAPPALAQQSFVYPVGPESGDLSLVSPPETGGAWLTSGDLLENGLQPPGLGTRGGLPAPQDTATFCCDRRHFWPAIGEIGILMVVPWYFNRHVADDSTAVLNKDSWERNIVEGFEWDRDAFQTNMWAHPYHGGLFFNTARSNGYNFWQSSFFSWTGSFLWENFGEANRPAINDWLSTSLGGVALGESLHRFSLMIWDNEATGFGRTMRELGGFLVNPMGGFNRLVRGEWTKVGPNPQDRMPPSGQGSALRLGYRFVGQGGQTEESHGGFFSFDYQYGNPFTDFGKPFDAFQFTAQLYGDNEVQRLGFVHLTASLYGKELKRNESVNHVFHFTQHFDYLNLASLETGGSSLAATFLSDWKLSDSWKVLTRLEPSILMIWGVDSEFSDWTQRDYDFGSGAGLRARASLRSSSNINFSLSYVMLWQHTLNGAAGDHILQLGAAQAFVPVYKKLGVGATMIVNARDSYYRDYPDVFWRNPEFRAYVAWQMGRGDVDPHNN